ncbi:putative 4-coumarate--CoA ligase-like 8 [Asparagus officinalis]|uniref:putative 4-coumarate--CoA ligase-like 8 n=1 Tax=Asparagus officinalis TaxID=4686 RepID=UPI00098E4958|nr:putative 4-coumarate--CoA ligase-like 8 [Asparagus officinalis]
MVVQMVRSGEVVKGYDLGSLKEVICSGAPLAREHMEKFVERFPEITLTQCYGLTETSGPITLCDGIKSKYHLSIGRLIPLIEAKIVDIRTGKALPPNKYGELRVRGPPVMQGYLKNPEATSVAIDEKGWLRTGDLCYIDLRGLVYVVDRIKELIKYKAYQVAPAELEEILSTHPDISDVAVTSYPDEEAGEIPMACVVRKPGNKIREEDIISFMENKVAPYKKIRKVLFVEYIPRSPSGKILRRHLKTTNLQHERVEISARL